MEGKKEIFYLMTHSIHFKIKDHLYSERQTHCHHNMGYFFLLAVRGCFIGTIPKRGQYIPWILLHQLRSTGWIDKNLNGSTMKDRSDDPLQHERTSTTERHLVPTHPMVTRKTSSLQTGIDKRPYVHNAKTVLSQASFTLKKWRSVK